MQALFSTQVCFEAVERHKVDAPTALHRPAHNTTLMMCMLDSAGMAADRLQTHPVDGLDGHAAQGHASLACD